MDGDRMIEIYVSACLESPIELNTEEERKFYKKLLNEMSEEKASGKAIEWIIPE